MQIGMYQYIWEEVSLYIYSTQLLSSLAVLQCRRAFLNSISIVFFLVKPASCDPPTPIPTPVPVPPHPNHYGTPHKSGIIIIYMYIHVLYQVGTVVSQSRYCTYLSLRGRSVSVSLTLNPGSRLCVASFPTSHYLTNMFLGTVSKVSYLLLCSSNYFCLPMTVLYITFCYFFTLLTVWSFT